MFKISLYSLILFSLTTLVEHQGLAAETPEQNPTTLFDISAYQGKTVYLDFWASWCKPCRQSFPWMNQLQEKYQADHLVVVAVNLDKKKSLALDFLKEHPANFKIIYDPQGVLAKQFAIKGMPSSVIFDSSGQALSAHTGFFVKKVQKYEQEIQQALAVSRKTLKQ